MNLEHVKKLVRESFAGQITSSQLCFMNGRRGNRLKGMFFLKRVLPQV
jgi:hypothetical protein